MYSQLFHLHFIPLERDVSDTCSVAVLRVAHTSRTGYPLIVVLGHLGPTMSPSCYGHNYI